LFSVLENESYGTIDISDGLYENMYRHSISIRIPPLEEQIKFDITYYVAPDANERHFFGIAVFLLLLVALVGLKVIDYEVNPSLAFLRPVGDHLNTLLGGIVTISLVVIGLFRNCCQ
jgi:hypothetical protein